MPVVCFYDFDVIAFGKISRGYFKQLHGHVDADTHIGGEYDGNDLRCFFNDFFPVVIESGCADDHFDAFFDTISKMFEGPGRSCEIDDIFGVSKRFIHVGFN